MTEGDTSPTAEFSNQSENSGHSTVHAKLVNDEGFVTLCGELDHNVVPQLDDALARLLSEGVDRLVVDFARLSFFDSACIGALVRAHASATERGGTVKLVNVDQYAYRVLQIAGLLPLFEVEQIEREV
ncbi:STAS domain-containing protein [Saccharomonospora sp.]|uniref:STAS domain-containing protein n=1 Tax=Saccharomonospora sp. TaxID=33913 RepID=UPI00262B9B14|nr:STAS domain-containing protein [Saccharomonospora sp.]